MSILKPYFLSYSMLRRISWILSLALGVVVVVVVVAEIEDLPGDEEELGPEYPTSARTLTSLKARVLGLWNFGIPSFGRNSFGSFGDSWEVWGDKREIVPLARKAAMDVVEVGKMADGG